MTIPSILDNTGEYILIIQKMTKMLALILVLIRVLIRVLILAMILALSKTG